MTIQWKDVISIRYVGPMYVLFRWWFYVASEREEEERGEDVTCFVRAVFIWKWEISRCEKKFDVHRSMKLDDSEGWRRDDCELIWSYGVLFFSFFFQIDERRWSVIDRWAMKSRRKVLKCEIWWQILNSGSRHAYKIYGCTWCESSNRNRRWWRCYESRRGGKEDSGEATERITLCGGRRVTRTIADTWLVGFHAHNYRWAKSYFNWESPPPTLALAKYTTLGYTTWNKIH